MAVLNGVVLSNELFKEYMKFSNGDKDYSKDIIKRIMPFYFDGFITNVKQYNDCGIDISQELKSNLLQAGMDSQSLRDLARDYSLYKIVLTNDPAKKEHPFVNIDSKSENISMSLTGSFKFRESRQKALDHLVKLCEKATEITIYDQYLNSTRDVNVQLRIQQVLNKIIPTKDVKVEHCKLHTDTERYLKQCCNKRNFESFSPNLQKKLHDRYMIIDNRLEIIITSGFDHLSYEKGAEMTYVIRDIHAHRSVFR